MGAEDSRFSPAKGFALEARANFPLLRQKKVAKEKATPGYAVGCAESPALLETGGGCGTRATPSNSPRPFSAGFSVARRSTRGPRSVSQRTGYQEFECHGQPGKKPKNEIPSLLTDALPDPLRGAEQRRNVGGSRLALSEPKASLASRPAFRVAQGSRRSRPRNPGSPFLWLLSFGEAKESKPASKAEPQAQPRESAISPDYIRKIPNFVSSAGAFIDADNPKPRTRRVSAGSIIPSSHSRAEA